MEDSRDVHYIVYFYALFQKEREREWNVSSFGKTIPTSSFKVNISVYDQPTLHLELQMRSTSNTGTATLWAGGGVG